MYVHVRDVMNTSYSMSLKKSDANVISSAWHVPLKSTTVPYNRYTCTMVSHQKVTDVCRGWLTGKYKRAEAPPKGSRVEWTTANNLRSISGPAKEYYENDEQCWKVLDTLDAVSKETGT